MESLKKYVPAELEVININAKSEVITASGDRDNGEKDLFPED